MKTSAAMDENASKPSGMFTLKGWLWAAFWVTVSLAAAFYPERSPWAIQLGRFPRGHDMYVITAATIAAYVIVVSLCAAGGTILGHHKRGLVIGLIAAAGSFCSTIIEVVIAAG